MDSMETLNASDARVSRTLHHGPLLNLILAASILSKITQGKAYLQSPWVPFRPIFGYYPQQPLHPLWYPIDPFIFPSRIYSSLTTNVPQLQPPPLNQQQIIHIHEAPPLTGEGEGYEDSKNKYTQSINSYPQVDETAPDETDPSSSNLNQQATADGGEPLPDNDQEENNHENYEQIQTASSNQDEVYEPLSLVLHDYDEMDDENVTINEIPEPSTPYGKPVERNITEIEEIEEVTTEDIISTSTTISPEESLTTEVLPSTTTEVYETTEEGDLIAFNEIEAKPQETSNPCILPPELASVNSNDRFEFPNDLQMAEANNVQRRKQRPQSNYEYDYYEDDYAPVQHKRKQRPTTPPKKTQRPRPYRVQPTRINSKRGQYRSTTAPYNIYDDDYDFTTQKLARREPTRRNSYRRTTTPSYELDYYEETKPKETRRKTNRYGMRRATTPIQDEYYGDEGYEDNEDDYQTLPRQKIRPRQEITTTEIPTTATTMSTMSTTVTSGTSTDATPEMTPTTTPTVGYPYYGSNQNGNLSITYGPPQNLHPGYGPSNGNEHISITYGPPAGQNQNISPLLDSWYNQYAKSSVIKRIQELLAPNNFYSPQYEADKFNYNDNVF